MLPLSFARFPKPIMAISTPNLYQPSQRGAVKYFGSVKKTAKTKNSCFEKSRFFEEKSRLCGKKIKGEEVVSLIWEEVVSKKGSDSPAYIILPDRYTNYFIRTYRTSYFIRPEIGGINAGFCKGTYSVNVSANMTSAYSSFWILGGSEVGTPTFGQAWLLLNSEKFQFATKYIRLVRSSLRLSNMTS